MVEDDLVVLHSPHPPVAHLVGGQILEDQLPVLVDVGELRLPYRREQHDRRGRDAVVRLCGGCFGAGRLHER
ncbi:hypothetical protein [Streptomyces microflavus]|uniref:hypothetical protein n=1 Tax=Streptomyces microflavus TaxID=1919 RepID=UPI00368151B3